MTTDSVTPRDSLSTPGAANAASVQRKSPLTGRIDRYLAPVLITAILLGGQLTFGILEGPHGYYRTLLAIATSIAMEMALGRLVTGKWPQLASAYITGISVGIIIRSPEFWPYALCSAIAIVSKYAIRYKGRHLWNPSNLAVSLMFFLAADSVAPLMDQWGNNTWAMLVIWILGTLIIGRLKRFHICFTYVLSFLVLAWVRSHFIHQTWRAEIAPITGPPYQLFIFFMITDPKTTVRTKWAQCLTAFVIAVVECVLRVLPYQFPNSALIQGIGIHAPYYALFLVGPIANLIEITSNSRKTLLESKKSTPQAGLLGAGSR